ncbi:MAG TPA: hypothetical protein PKY82_16770 [Pyrinomonadaceae bacterium]|nr:hypothetical protein [Pyrinomonadaceae bacterium]
MMILRRNNWTKLGIVLSLMFSVFSLSAIAQDKPMSANALAGLITDLKEVVSKNSPNEKDAQLVSAKWDKRRDLTGKTKSVVINLLWDDVKAVIKDSGVQYQIYSIFSFTKQIPDEQFAKSGAKATNPSKKELVEKLVDLVFMSHPYVNIEKQLEGLPGTKSAQEIEKINAEAQRQRYENFDDALKVNKKLTATQKTFVKANYERLSKMVDQQIDATIKLNFPTEQWVQEGMEKIFAKRFAAEEINNLTAFFDSDKGGQVLKYVRQTEMEQLITGNGGKLDFTESDKAEHDKFVATALGKKFIAAYIKETEEYEALKEGEVRRNVPNADGFALLEPINLNKFFNKFVAENYKQ